jgi:hypothetical protein
MLDGLLFASTSAANFVCLTVWLWLGFYIVTRSPPSKGRQDLPPTLAERNTLTQKGANDMNRNVIPWPLPLLTFVIMISACTGSQPPTTVLIPQTPAAPTATPVPPTPIPPTATSQPPTATSALPTPTQPPSIPETPQTTPTVQPTRIAFEPGATSATIVGNLTAQSADHYVLRAMADQLMDVSVSAPQDAVRLVVYGADGTVLKSGMGEFPSFRGYLPKTQDYLIRVEANSSVQYTLNVMIPQRIAFQPGTTSASIEGELSPHSSHHYVLRAMADQLMDVSVSAPQDAVRLVVYGVDGTVLKSGMGGPPSFRGYLPTTQDYLIHVAASDRPVQYTLDVIIPQRITFKPGATSEVILGSITGHSTHHYVLRAMANQSMGVNITSPTGDVFPEIYGQDGTVLKRAADDSPSWEGELPSSQDYWVNAVSLGQDTTYKIEISITD